MGENMFGRAQGKQLPHAPAARGKRLPHRVGRQRALERRQLPKACQQTARRAAADADQRTAADEQHRALLDPARFFCCAERQHRGIAPVIAQTQMLQRTVAAQRRAVRQADCGAQLHERLIEVARPVLRQKRGKLPAHTALVFGIRDGCELIVQPRGDAQHVAVHRRNRQAKGDRSDRAGGVFADAGQREQLIVIGRQFPAVFRADLDRSAVQIAHPGIVAQPLPELHIHALVRRSKRRNIRQRLHPAVKIAAHSLDARLLQHDLAHPHAVRRGPAAPRQIAVALIIPCEQRGSKRRTDAAQSCRSSSVCPV